MNRSDVTRQLQSSDAPNFKAMDLVEAPVLDKKTGDISVGLKVQHYLDPEKRIEATSNYPGASGHDQPLERFNMQQQGQTVPFGGSSDARPWMEPSHSSTADVWGNKAAEAAAPRGSWQHKWHRSQANSYGTRRAAWNTRSTVPVCSTR